MQSNATHSGRLAVLLLLGAFILSLSLNAQGQDPSAVGTDVPTTAASASHDEATTPALKRIKISGHIDGGYTYNPDHPRDHRNFGRLFDDRANRATLNQVMFTVERPLDPLARSFDWGFKLQVMYGADARYTHYIGELDNFTHHTNQPDIVEAYLNTHFPILTKGGIDVKLGQFVTLEGIEVIDSTGNFFYSHSYIFNFGIPFKHTGVMITTHLTDHLDLMTGVVRGVNAGWRDNNDSWAFHGGATLHVLDDRLIIVASTHIGNETPRHNSGLRYLNDIAITAKLTDKLTAMTDLNYTHDDLAEADCYGVAQYFTYAFTDWLAAGVRGEVFRDDDAFYVAQFGDNDDFADLQRGVVKDISPRTIGGGPTTYGALTFGMNIWPLKYVKSPSRFVHPENLLVRPEIRFDRALNSDSRPFNDSRDRNMFTAAIGVTYSF